MTEGEFHSAAAIDAVVPGLVPKPSGWSEFHDDGLHGFIFLGEFRDLDLSTAPDPVVLASQIATMHRHGTSPNGMFGFHVPTVIGALERKVTWQKSWANSFTLQLEDIILSDIETNGPWPMFEAAVRQLIQVVVPKVLEPLQSHGRDIIPALIHGDLWEQNVGTDVATGQPTVFDAGCTYAHNEMEFGTWSAFWATHFKSQEYLQAYQRHIGPSEPVEQWDDRHQLYRTYVYLAHSAGHPGSLSRER